MPSPRVPDKSDGDPLRGMDLHEHLHDPARKQQFVTKMFDVIAPRYDDFTRIFSFGMDVKWKQHLLRMLDREELVEGVVADLACGTGDFAVAIAAMHPGRSVIGIDASARMITAAIGRRDSGVANASDERRPHFAVGDMMQLPLPPGTVALTTAGYGFRNVPDLRAALREAALCMRSGALLVTLDFYKPPSALWRWLFLLYLRVAGKIVGWLWHRSPAVYEYISHSIAAFVTADAFTEELRAAGFEVVHERRWLFGGIAAHISKRRG